MANAFPDRTFLSLAQTKANKLPDALNILWGLEVFLGTHW